MRAIAAKYEGGPSFGREDWDEVFGHCMVSVAWLCRESRNESCVLTNFTAQVISDWPAVAFSEELIQTYPEAKVILSVRDSAESWKASVARTLVTTARESRSSSFLVSIFQPFVPKTICAPAYQAMVTYDKLLDIPRDGIERYHNHNNRIKRLVPDDNLLEFNVKQGWDPLCKFLGHEVPDTPFPHVNDLQAYLDGYEELKKQTGIDALRNMAWTFGLLLAVAAGIVKMLYK